MNQHGELKIVYRMQIKNSQSPSLSQIPTISNKYHEGIGYEEQWVQTMSGNLNQNALPSH